MKSDRRILETYKLYISSDVKKYIKTNKMNYLPKINIPKAVKSPKKK